MNPFTHSTITALQYKTESSLLASRAAFQQSLSTSKNSSTWLRLVLALCAVLVSINVVAVELNTANMTELQSLKGIGPKTAALIIEERDRGGPFEDAQDLGERVRGLGPKKLAGLLEAGLSVAFSAEEQKNKTTKSVVNSAMK